MTLIARLEAECERLRKLAHEAPMAELYAENQNGEPTGKLKIREHTYAWSSRGDEWLRARQRLDEARARQKQETV